MAAGKGKEAMGGRAGQQIAGLGLEMAEPKDALLPSAGTVIQAGAFGAAFSGVAAGIADTGKVRDGEMSRQEAVRDVAQSSLQGAATMAMASTVAHMARTRPLLGLGVLALAGLGLLATARKKPAAPSAESPAG